MKPKSHAAYQKVEDKQVPIMKDDDQKECGVQEWTSSSIVHKSTSNERRFFGEARHL